MVKIYKYKAQPGNFGWAIIYLNNRTDYLFFCFTNKTTELYLFSIV